MKEVRIGLIGTGYIGKVYAIAYTQAPAVFNLRGRLVCEVVAEVNPAPAAERAQAFGFDRSAGGRRVLMADPAIDVMDIYSPSHLRKEMVLGAIRHGKHVYSKKSLALNAHDTREMVDTAKQAGVKTLVGFDYMKNPTTQLAKEIIARGGVGEVIHSYETRNEDYMADPLSPIYWRCFKETAGLGAPGDLVAHIVNVAQCLMGEIEQVRDDLKIVVPARPVKAGSSEVVTVENKDQAHAMVHFVGGAQGVIETSHITCGHEVELSYVITGTRGATSFTQERMVEIKLYLHNDPANRQGFRTLLVGSVHLDHGMFCMGAGHGIGFSDQKTVEVRDLVDGITTDALMWSDFEEGWRVSCVLDAVALSHQ